MQGGGALEEEEKAGGTREVSYSVDFVCNLPRSPPSVVERYFTQRFYGLSLSLRLCGLLPLVDGIFCFRQH